MRRLDIAISAAIFLRIIFRAKHLWKPEVDNIASTTFLTAKLADAVVTVIHTER